MRKPRKKSSGRVQKLDGDRVVEALVPSACLLVRRLRQTPLQLFSAILLGLRCSHGSSNNRDNQERPVHRHGRSGFDRRCVIFARAYFVLVHGVHSRWLHWMVRVKSQSRLIRASAKATLSDRARGHAAALPRELGSSAWLLIPRRSWHFRKP